MIVLFTDFGLEGPYAGQMKAVLAQLAPRELVVDLFSDAPACNPKAAAYLLPAYTEEFPLDTVFLCVVDPGVGSAARRPVIVRSSGRWFVGPDNGLFDILTRRGSHVEWWEIAWRPQRLSNTFHGRDLFAPVAAHLARGILPSDELIAGKPLDGGLETGWPDDLYEIVYVDHFGNAMAGIRTASLSSNAVLKVGKHTLPWARTFSDVVPGQGFWYGNANGLVEIAVNQGRADQLLELKIGNSLKYM